MKKKIAVITQPTYLPWLGYFEQIARADVFVFLDNVQYVKRSWMVRNRFLDEQATVTWLTVPIKACPQKTIINDVAISGDEVLFWQKHLQFIAHNYRKAPYFDITYEMLEKLFAAQYSRLAELNIDGIKMIAKLLNLTPVILRASELKVPGKKTELLANICKEVGCGHYYSAYGSKGYMDEEIEYFDRLGISVEYQEWVPPAYKQINTKEFISHLSVIDVIMNIGFIGAQKLISRGNLNDDRNDRSL